MEYDNGHQNVSAHLSPCERSTEPSQRTEQVRRLGTVHAGFDPLEHIKRELSEIEVTITGLKEQSAFAGVAQKYAEGMLQQLRRRRADLLELKKQWLKPVGGQA